MALYSGIDLHGNNNVTLLLDAHDQVIIAGHPRATRSVPSGYYRCGGRIDLQLVLACSDSTGFSVK